MPSFSRSRFATARLAMLVLAGIGAAGRGQAEQNRSSGWILRNVTVVDTVTGRLARQESILIDGGRIIRVGRGLRGNPSVDGHGAFVIPGYNDMHAHPLNPDAPPASLQLMLANGITGFRQMSGSPQLLAARRAGPVTPPDAPMLLVTPGNILTPPLVAPTPDAVIAEVRRQREQGADFIKIVALPPPAFFAAGAEATRLGLPFVGHLPPTVDVRQASEAHMRAIEHLGPRESILLGCSTEEGAIRRDMATAPQPPQPPSSGPAASGIPERVLANPILATDPPTFDRLQRVVDTFSAERCRELAHRFVVNQTWQVPTLIRLRTMQFGDDPIYRNDPHLRFIPSARRQLWEQLGRDFEHRITPLQRDTLRRLFGLQLRLVKLFDEAGVPMLAGSDYGGGWEVAGFSLHQEFDLLAEAGLSPLRVLQMSTLDAARFLNREGAMGRVAAGLNADLVLLAANPIASVANLHRIQGVVRGGRYHSRAALDALIRSAGERVSLDSSGTVEMASDDD